MTLGTLILYISIIALVLTLAILLPKAKEDRHWLLSYLQNFAGVLFVISGWVKAVDPMGTAFKMEQYFAEFESTFSETALGFVAPVFPWLSEQAIAFSVFMIILEIVIGLMLIMGHKRKFTAWVFLIILAFFTFLTGFTYLTGYVPPDANFFNFDAWSSYNTNNMRVTDCGCFGDFIKLEPKTSFLKDVVLLVPALLFVFRSKHMHQLFTPRGRSFLVVTAIVGLLIYCMSNYMWDLPHADFRPFKEGVDIYEKKQAEEEAAGSVQVVAWKLKEKETGKVVELSNEVYMNDYKSYPSEEWEILEQVTSEPPIPITKISDFEILTSDGEDMTYDIVENEEPLLMIVSYKLKGKVNYVEKTRRDTLFRQDTVQVGDSIRVDRVIDRIEDSQVTEPEYEWNEAFVEKFENKVRPVLDAAGADGVNGFVVVGGASGEKISSFAYEAGLKCPMYEADDIMLKTIIRSNPGFVLLQDGKIIGKWHHAKVPSWEEMKSELP